MTPYLTLLYNPEPSGSANTTLRSEFMPFKYAATPAMVPPVPACINELADASKKHEEQLYQLPRRKHRLPHWSDSKFQDPFLGSVHHNSPCSRTGQRRNHEDVYRNFRLHQTPLWSLYRERVELCQNRAPFALRDSNSSL